MLDPAFDPDPSSPKLIEPQHSADPADCSPHEYTLPASTVANWSPFPAGTGVAEVGAPMEGPFPNWPNTFDPQQYRAAPMVNAQLDRNPVLTTWNAKAALFSTATGTAPRPPTAPL